MNVVDRIKYFKQIEDLPVYSETFQDYQKNAILKEFIISKYTLGLDKDVYSHTVNLNECKQKEKIARSLKGVFSYDILLNPFYAK